IRLANLFLSRAALDAEGFVVVFALSHIKRQGTGRLGEGETILSPLLFFTQSPSRAVAQSPPLLLHSVAISIRLPPRLGRPILSRPRRNSAVIRSASIS